MLSAAQSHLNQASCGENAAAAIQITPNRAHINPARVCRPWTLRPCSAATSARSGGTGRPSIIARRIRRWSGFGRPRSEPGGSGAGPYGSGSTTLLWHPARHWGYLSPVIRHSDGPRARHLTNGSVIGVTSRGVVGESGDHHETHQIGSDCGCGHGSHSRLSTHSMRRIKLRLVRIAIAGERSPGGHGLVRRQGWQGTEGIPT